MEKIISIEEGTFKSESKEYKGDFRDCDGFIITTDKQVIKIGIDNDSQCCEHWGYFASLDNFEEFIGAEIKEINLVDDCLNVDKLNEYEFYEVALMFVNIETDKGTLQFTAYNDNNGCYIHEAVVISEQLNHSELL